MIGSRKNVDCGVETKQIKHGWIKVIIADVITNSSMGLSGPSCSKLMMSLVNVPLKL